MKNILLLLGLFMSMHLAFSQITDQNGKQAVDSSGNPLNGNIGIGTTTPSSKLEIVNTSPTLDHFRISSSATSNGDIFEINKNGEVIINSKTATGIKITADNNPRILFNHATLGFRGEIMFEDESNSPDLRLANYTSNGGISFVTRPNGVSQTFARLSSDGRLTLSSRTIADPLHVIGNGNIARFQVGQYGDDTGLGTVRIDNYQNKGLRIQAGVTTNLEAYAQLGIYGTGYESSIKMYQNGNVEIPNSLFIGDAGTIDSSAKAEVKSTTKGFLPPRMTDVSTAIASPATGLQAYQTGADEGLYLKESTGWAKVLTSSDSPSMGGGKFVDGTNPLDAVYTGGDIGIGTDTPNNAKLEIVNTDPTKKSFAISKSVSGNGDIFGVGANGQVGIFHDGNSIYQSSLNVFRTTTGNAQWVQMRKNGVVALELREDLPDLYQLRSYKALDLATADGPVSVRSTSGDGVGINTISPHPSASLDVAATNANKGFLPPRMTNVSTAIASPATGLQAYQTGADEGLYLKESTGWAKVLTSSDSPSMGGGKFVDGTNPLDAVYTGGDIGIGTDTPNNAKLEIVNTDPTKPHFKISSTTGGDGDILEIDELGELRLSGRIYMNEGRAISSPGGILIADAGSSVLVSSINKPLSIGTGSSQIVSFNSTGRYIFKGNVGLIDKTLFVGDNALIDVSAKLEVKSTTKGFLPPRMTDVSTAIASPATGLQAYQTGTDEGLYLKESTGWAKVLTSSDSSSMGGGKFVDGSNPLDAVFMDGKVGIGTTDLNQNGEESLLIVDGKILAEEIKVIADIVAPDFVFQKYYTGKSNLNACYTLPTLAEVEAYTKVNHHLPEIPSASELKENGMHLKKMTTLLLQKIEELTLYAIEQDKTITNQHDNLKTQETELQVQIAKNKNLEQRLLRIERFLAQKN